MIRFNIEQWRAWAPGLDSTTDWLRWSESPCLLPDAGEQPNVDFLPPMQRRRLSRLARMAFHVAWPLAAESERLPLVYVSRHGETTRTYAILSDLGHGEPISPTQFSLSVHNAVIGLWSILRNDTSEMSAIGAEGDGLELGVLEACGLLADGAPSVLLIIAEERPAAAYDDWIDDVPFSYAVALRLTQGADWALSCGAGDVPNKGQWPNALDLVSTLALRANYCSHTWNGRQWNWQRHR